ncbi:MAG: (2Fe-2S)-binding protein [Leptolyngbya sp.]|nr:(2Fe-2S)-binding protein [Candidatus Melainabacteria bacterium]
MWICSCHAVNDGQIKAFAKEHGANWKLMTQVLKCGTQCGTCAKSAKEILEQAAGDNPKPRRQRKAPSTTAVTSTSPANSSPAAPSTDASASITSDLNRCSCACGKTACASLSASLAALVPSVPSKTE